jgi:transposase InsO family protein
MRRGFLYLVAIMDWFSRKVLAWRLSNTMDADFCVAALEEAIARHGKPDIFNTDQGSQFTSFAFTTTLKDAGIRISLDGRGRWMDNVFIERLWRSLKYECVFLSAFETGSEARNGIGSWIDYYNRRRPHSTFSGRPLLPSLFARGRRDRYAIGRRNSLTGGRLIVRFPRWTSHGLLGLAQYDLHALGRFSGFGSTDRRNRLSVVEALAGGGADHCGTGRG